MLKLGLKNRSKNFKGVLSLLAGNTISRIATTLGGLLLANYYGAESYGLYNVFLSYVLILPVITSLRLDNIMILQRGSKEIRNLFSGIITIIFVLNLAILLILMGIKASGIISIDVSYYLLALCGIGSVLTGWNLTQNYLFTKYKLFKQISVAFVLASVVSVIFQAIFYLLGLVESGLIYGWMVGLVASFYYNARVSKSRFGKTDFTQFKASVKEHSEIVKFTYPSDSINAIANNVMPFLILFYFTEKDVGVYSMAHKILTLPLMLLASSIARVYFQKASSLYSFDDLGLKKLTYKVMLSNVAIMGVFLLGMNTIGIYLLELFFRDGWEGLRIYIFALTFWMIARSAVNPISDVIIVLRKNHFALIFNIYLLLVNFIGIYVGVQKNSFELAIWMFSILSGIGYFILLGIIIYNLEKNARKRETKF